MIRRFSVFVSAVSALLCVAASPAWAQTGNGLVGEYYNSNNHSGAIADTRFNETGLPPGATFNFAYGAGGPGGAIALTNNFSIRWRGQIEFAVAETAAMRTVVNNATTADTARLVINGTQITTGTGTQNGNFVVPAPGKYDIMIEYTEGTADGSFVLQWGLPSLGGVVGDVPNNRLYSPLAIPNLSATPDVNTQFVTSQDVTLSTTTPGAVIKYGVALTNGDPGFSPGPGGTVYGGTLNFTTLTRVSARSYLEGVSSSLISFVVSPNFPAVTDPGNRVTGSGLYFREYTGNGVLTTPFPATTAIPRQQGLVLRPTHLTPPLPIRLPDDNNFAYAFTGYITVPETGFWTFFTFSDDGSRVFIDGVEVVNNNFGQPQTERSGDIYLTAGLHRYEAQYSNGTGSFIMEARWQAIGGVTPKQIIPDAAFSTDEVVATPTFTPNGGGFATTQNVQLNCTTPGAILYYTLDGTFPDPKLATGSVLPGTSITLNATTTVRVVGIRPGLNPSLVASALFRKSPQFSSVVSSASTATNHEVTVVFDKPVDQTAAETLANYSLSGGLTIDSATLLTRPGAGAVLSNGLLGHWKLDDIFTDVDTFIKTTDSSVNANKGVVSLASRDTGNKTPAVQGNLSSFSFNGANNCYISVPHNANLNPGLSSFTVSVWINPTNLTAANKRIVNKYFDANTAGWVLDLNQNGVIRFLLRDAGLNAIDYVTGDAMVVAGQWNHIAARVDKLTNRATVFLNGQQYGPHQTLVTGFGSVANTAPVGIGTIPTGTSALTNSFLGNIDEFRYYSASLSDNEIYALSQGSPHVNSAVRLAINPATPLVAATTYTLTANNISDTLTPAAISGAQAQAFLHRATGTLTYERYASTATSTVADLARTAAFPNSPNGFLTPALTEVATNQADSYGARMRGYFIPGTTGDWKFAISTQDQGKIFLSMDADPSNKRLIAQNNASTTAVRDFDDPATESVQIPLTADQKYYFEAYIKDNSGTDYISIAAKVNDATAFLNPDNNQLTGAQISPWVDPIVILTQPVSRIATLGSTPVSFSITAQATLQGLGSPRYQWKKNGGNIVVNGNGSTYTIPAGLVAGDAGDYTCEVSDGVTIANNVTSAVATLTVLDFAAPPTIGGLDLTNGPSAGGQDITITGTNFVQNQTTVVFGTSQTGFSAAVNVIVVDPNTITCTTSSHLAGTVDVQVTTYNPTPAISLNAYTYHDSPTIAAVGGLNPIATNEAATPVTITGTNFVVGQTSVTFGATTIPAGSVTVSNATTLTVTSPVSPTPGTLANVNVTVTTPGGTSAPPRTFTYYPPPVIANITPDSGNRLAAPVTINGSNFAPNLTTVTFLTVGAAGSVVATNPQITCTAPAFAGAGTDPITVEVSTPGGVTTTTYTYYGPPSISSITPSAGTRGAQAVVIQGSNFAPGQTAVTFLGLGSATGITAVNNQIDCTTPANPGVGITPVTVQVTTPGGGPATTTYTYYAAPTISLISADTGPHTGSLVTITGTNFSTVGGQTTVTFGAIGTVPATATNSTTLTCTAPPSGTTGTLVVNVTVNAPGGSSGTLPFTYRDGPTFTSIDLTSGPSQGGQAVTITGTNFVTAQTSVTFGGAAATNVNVTSSTTLNCTTPGHDFGAVQIAITTPAGTGTSAANAYTYVGPRIVAVTPNTGPISGAPGVVITGSGFTGATAVDFGGSAASITLINGPGTSMTVQTSAHAAALVAVSVTVGADTATLAAAYTYVSTATVSGVSPTRGPASGGQTVTVTGTGFAAGQTSVTIGGTIIPAGSVNVSNATTLSFATPLHAAGLVDVSVTTFSNPPVTLPNSYTFVDPATITAVVPNRGPIAGGQTVTLTGTNFELGLGDTTVTVDVTTVPAVVASATSLTFTTPNHVAGATTVKVNTFALQSSTTAPYTYIDPANTVDLSLSMAVDNSTPMLGTNVTFTLTLSNSGVQNATGVSVSAPLPAGLTQVTATPSVGTYTAGLWTVGNLATPASATLTIVATVGSTIAQVFSAEVLTCAQNDVDSTVNNGIVGEDDLDQETLSAGLTIQTAAGALPASTTGAFYYQQITATGGVPPYRWSLAAGSTPLPFDLDPLTGVISGTGPVATGAFPFTLQVSDSNATPGAVTRNFSITVNGAVVAPPTITTSPLPPGGTVGVAYSHTFTAGGGAPPYTWSVPVGALPAGLVLNAMTGQVGGTPTAAGIANFTMRASNATAPPSDQPFSITIVANPVTIATTSIANGSVGSPYDQTIQATGGLGPTFNWTVSSGTLPNGLTLTGSSRIATITGTPASNGAFNFTLQAVDAAGGASDTQVFIGQILVGSAPFAPTSTTNPPRGTIGDFFSMNLTGLGGTRPYTWTLAAGTLPTGITFNGAAGTISGTPTVAGVFQIQVQAQDSAVPSASGSQTILINIAPAPVITTASPLPSPVSGLGYSVALTAVGGAPPLTWTVTGGALPAGLTLNANSGAISGTTAVLGSASATVTVTDANGVAGSKPFSLTVANPAAATLSILDVLPPAEVGVPYSATVQVVGGTLPYVFALAPGSTIPAWATFDTATGTIYGTPDGSPVTFQILVTDAGSGNATSSALGVTTPLAIVQTSLPAGGVGSAYATSLTVTGGAPGSPLWTLVSGSLPSGLTLDVVTGLLSGVPQTAGVSTFTVRAADTAGATVQRQFSVTVGAVAPPGGGGGGGGGGCGLTGAELLLLWVLRRRRR